MVKHFLHLIRYQNLVLIALVQFLVHQYLIIAFFPNATLCTFHFILLLFSTVTIAAAGNCINDIYDVEIDKINKPNCIIVDRFISKKNAFNIYFILNIIGVGLGFYIANNISKPSFAVIFIFTSLLLYSYSTRLKSKLLIGNMAISILVALSILIIPIFEIVPVITSENQPLALYIFKITLLYAAFAFYINLLREFVKTVEDVNGDFNFSVTSIAIILGKSRTLKLVAVLITIPLIFILQLTYTYIYINSWATAYSIFLVFSPLIFISTLCWKANSKKSVKKINMLLKVAMFLGILSILVLHFTKIFEHYA
ncbi:geranylgeranylglycerol-phosphate geranylgeranyltransferase [Zhouia sp. PK063]|uniref:geranylgeranylglycerol-phosphate geranylgeranyltransferase n=1 Tax=Zhouia sp. PK063 TaxID=3373602 RepID=UPI0037A9564A